MRQPAAKLVTGDINARLGAVETRIGDSLDTTTRIDARVAAIERALSAPPDPALDERVARLGARVEAALDRLDAIEALSCEDRIRALERDAIEAPPHDDVRTGLDAVAVIQARMDAVERSGTRVDAAACTDAIEARVKKIESVVKTLVSRGFGGSKRPT